MSTGKERGYNFCRNIRIQGTEAQHGPSNTDFVMSLGQQLQNVKRVSFMNVVFSNSYYNVQGSGPNENNRMTISYYLANTLVITQNILVPSGFYTVEELVSKINSLINSSSDLTFHAETTIDRKVSIIFVPNGFADKVVIHASAKGEGIMELLGFEFGATSTIVPNVETFAFNLPNLQGLDEVYLRSYALAPSSSIDSKGVLDSICVCIPINVAWGAQQIFDCKVDALCQITYPAPRNLQNLDIQLVNKRGSPVDLNGSDLRIDLRFWFDTI